MQALYIDNRQGRGLVDFTKFLMDAGQFTDHKKNEPALFDFQIAPVSGVAGWDVPLRGAYVRFYDNRWESRHARIDDGVLFTGYVTEDPDPVFLGVDPQGEQYWAYRLKCTSEEFLANSKRLPTVTYVNKTRGFILKDLLRRLFPTGQFPFDLDGIMDGGVEQVYQVDTDRKWSEIAKEFAEADGYTYWVLDHLIYYGPEDTVTDSNDPLVNLVIDEEDPRYNPDNVDIKRISREIVNDVTVLGEDEPTDIVSEHFISDGYQGFHNLAFDPFGVTETVIVNDDFTASLDTGVWEERDAFDDYIQVFEGALNVTGGTGYDTGAVYLRLRRPVEVAGIIECRDGELYFPPSPTGSGIIGGLYVDENVKVSSLWCGWHVDATNRGITPFGPNGMETAYSYRFSPTRHYVLRRFIETSRPLGSSQIYIQQSTGTGYAIDPFWPESYAITWVVDEINNDDAAMTFTTRTTLLSKTYNIAGVVSHLLYCAVVPYDLHCVMNFVRVAKPQQAILTVDGNVQKLGAYLDGGRATLTSENGRGTLAWYSVPGNDLSYKNMVTGDGATAYWRLSETGTTRYDHSGYGHNGTATGIGALNKVPGAIRSEPDEADYFNGNGAFSLGSISVAATCSYEAWFKTTYAQAESPILAGNYSHDLLALNATGHILVGDEYDLTQSQRGGLNDGLWHHVVWTNNTVGDDRRIYIDGVLDYQLARGNAISSGPMYLAYHPTGPTAWVGSLDEVAIYSGVVLSAEKVKQHYARGMSTQGEVVTVPKAGSRISIRYYRKRASRARLRSTASIALEQSRYKDDGIRQKIIRAGDSKPSPRTSEECLALATAYLADATTPRYEGTYSIDVVENTPTELRTWPMPGDWVKCKLDLPDGAIDDYLILQTVNSEFLGKGAYRLSLGFGPITRYDAVQRQLLLRRRTSLDDPIIPEAETDTLEETVVSYGSPADITDCKVSNITATQFTLTLYQLGIPDDVENIEVRTEDTGWGSTAGAGYAGRFRAQSWNFSRLRRDLRYFLRPYNEKGVYAKRSAVVRVAYPIANTNVMTGVTGDINPSRIRVEIPLPRDRDLAGVIIAEGSSSGPLLYKGNGIDHDTIGNGVLVLSQGSSLTVDLPNPNAIRSYTVFVNTYNLLNLYGTGQTVVIDKEAPVITQAVTQSSFDPSIFQWAGTADEWRVTAYGPNGVPRDVITVPGDVQQWNFGGSGEEWSFDLEARDDYGTSDSDTSNTTGDDGVPSAPASFSATVSETPDADGKLSFIVWWSPPATNYRTIYEYKLEVADNAGFSGGVEYQFSAEANNTNLALPGVTRYFRMRAANNFGNGSYSNTVGPLTTKGPIDSLGEGGDWDYTQRNLNRNIRTTDSGGTPSRYVYEVEDSADRALSGLESDGDVARDVPYGIDIYDGGGTPRAFIHVAHNVSALANGSTVEGGATRANSGLASNGDVARHLPYAVDIYDSGGTLRDPFLEDVGTFDHVAEGSTYKRTTTNQRDGGGYAYTGLDSSGYIIIGVYTDSKPGGGTGSWSADDMWELLDRVFYALQAGYPTGYRVEDNMVDRMSMAEDEAFGEHSNYVWRGTAGLPGSGDGFQREL